MNLALAIANSTEIGKTLICYLVILKNHCARFDVLRHTRIILILLIIQRYSQGKPPSNKTPAFKSTNIGICVIGTSINSLQEIFKLK